MLSGALAHPALFAAYRSGVPAASGGVWDRAAAVQALDAALDAGDPQALGGPLARRRRRAFGARPAGGAGAGICRPAGGARSGGGAPRRPARRWPSSSCSPAPTTPRATPPGRTGPPLRGAPRRRRRRACPPPAVDGDLVAAALAGLAGDPPRRRPRGCGSRDLATGGRQGQAILAALDLVQGGGEVDPPALRAALLTLRLAGQEESARAIALQTLLAGRRLMPGRRPLARALPRGDPGRARRLAQHRPFLRPRSQRLRRLPCRARPGLRQRRPRRDRGLPRRPGRPRHGARHPGAPAFGDPPALPLRLPRGLARGRPRRRSSRGPKRQRALPGNLSEGEVDRLLDAAGTLGRTEAERLRDTCLLQVLYATGLRVSELVSLPVAAVARRPADDPRARQGRARAHGPALAAGARRARRLARAPRRRPRGARRARARPSSSPPAAGAAT